MKKISFGKYSKKRWYLYLIFASILFIPLLILLLCFCGELNNFGAWASIVLGSVTYIGAVSIAIFTDYQTWVAKRKDELKNCCFPKIVANVMPSGIYKTGTDFPYFTVKTFDEKVLNSFRVVGGDFLKKDDCNMESINFHQLSDEIKMMRPTKIYYEEDGKIKACDSFLYQIEKKDDDTIFHFGLNKDCFPRNYCDVKDHILAYFEFKVYTIYGGYFYSIVAIIYGSTFQVFRYSSMTEMEYNYLIENYGSPITPTWFETQFSGK